MVAKVCLIRAQLYVIILKGGPEGLAAKLCLIMAQSLVIRVKMDLECAVLVGSVGSKSLNLRVAKKAIEMVEVEMKYLPTV